MTRAIHYSAGNHRAPKAKRGLEQFSTPPCAVEALIKVEPLAHGIWDPCTGENSIVNVLRQHGHHAIGNDLAERKRRTA
jgi:hypothetical protein